MKKFYKNYVQFPIQEYLTSLEEQEVLKKSLRKFFGVIYFLKLRYGKRKKNREQKQKKYYSDMLYLIFKSILIMRFPNMLQRKCILNLLLCLTLKRELFSNLDQMIIHFVQCCLHRAIQQYMVVNLKRIEFQLVKQTVIILYII